MNEKYLNKIKDKLKDDFDVKYRSLTTSRGSIDIIFIDNLCDSKFISEYIIEPIIKQKDNEDLVSNFNNKMFYSNSVGTVKDVDDALLHIVSGDVVIIPKFSGEVLYCEAKGYVKRAVSTPITEAGLKGPREGFTEVLVDNISLIRRKVKNSDLKFESMQVGSKSNTTVVISYIKGVVEEKLIDGIRDKIKSMDMEFILGSNYIEEELKCKGTLFDTIGYSEKPDVVAAKLFQGRVAIIVDGTPFVATAPYFFMENFQVADDYYLNRYLVFGTRVLRVISFIIAVLLAPVYVAITTHHFGLIPSVFVFRLAASREGVPFPTVVEVLLLTFFFQILREAGIRLPQPIGQAMSIVGALILGEAAVGAGLASESTVIVVAVSSISSFLTPKLYGPIVFWSGIFTVFSSILGLVGLYISICVFFAHISSLTTCNYSYLFPLGTHKKFKFKDIIIRGELKNISRNILAKGDKK